MENQMKHTLKHFPSAIVDGKPCFTDNLPLNVRYVGMEKEPNKDARYGKVYHPWFSLPCYETNGEVA